MSKQKQFEDILKRGLISKSEEINPSEEMFHKIETQIKLNKEGSKFMFKNINFSIKKSIAAACLGLTFLIGSTLIISPSARAFAANNLNRFVNGYMAEKEYDKVPSGNELQKQAGFKVKMPQTLPGGYNILNVGVAGHVVGNADNSKLTSPDKKKEVGGIYEKNIDGNKSKLFLNVCNDKGTDYNVEPKTVKIGDKTARFFEYNICYLPEGEKLTPKEEADANAGKMSIVTFAEKSGKTNNKVKKEIKITHELKWEDNGVFYTLQDTTNTLTLDNMSKIAQSIIDIK